MSHLSVFVPKLCILVLPVETTVTTVAESSVLPGFWQPAVQGIDWVTETVLEEARGTKPGCREIGETVN